MSDAKNRPKIFLDIDINGNREAYKRACDFVEATDLRHGWSNKDLTKLGGSELARLEEAYESDYDWKDKGRIMLSLPPERIVIELYAKECPVTVKNFMALCTGEKGKGKNNIKLHYKGSRFHRIVSGFVCQGGDFIMQNGSGGESIYGKKFKDERAGLKLKFTERGFVGMCNTGKNSNSSQFFFTLAPSPKLNGKHVLFGKIAEGMEVLEMLEKQAGSTLKEEGKPKVEVVIADCGVVQ
uniref:Peptidyl-prolyl cis-trans isomerase n=1 Tax=Lotharella globosa TaxID=91324 RepID=A0A7S3Z7V0_9EUKA